MKKALLTLTPVVLALLAALGGLAWENRPAAAAVEAPFVTSTFQVEGMTCGGCEAGVKLAVKRLDGVVKVEASYEEKRATVTYDGAKVTPRAIVQAIEKLGYRARLVETKKNGAAPKSSGSRSSGSRSSGQFATLRTGG